MQITTGKIQSAQKVVIYGPEGIGKSTLASQFPNPVFIDTEGSTKHLDVARTPKPSSWTMLLEQIKYFKQYPNQFKTLVVDTADWAESLCISNICSKSQKSGIEDFGYGKGYTYLEEEFGRFLNYLEEVVEAGMNVVLNAHAQMRKFEQPDEMGAYDRWELKLEKKTAPLLKEWADTILFANFKTYVVNVDGQGAQKGKNKGQGNKRVMYATHHSCWDAKNRWGLPEELPFDYSAIAQHIPTGSLAPAQTQYTTPTQEHKPPVVEPPKQESQPVNANTSQEPVKPTQDPSKQSNTNLPAALLDLMTANQVTVVEIQKAVASRGYYPEDTPIENYDDNFISGVLVGAWQAVFGMIKESRLKTGEFVAASNNEEMPFDK